MGKQFGDQMLVMTNLTRFGSAIFGHQPTKHPYVLRPSSQRYSVSTFDFVMSHELRVACFFPPNLEVHELMLLVISGLELQMIGVFGCYSTVGGGINKNSSLQAVMSHRRTTRTQIWFSGVKLALHIPGGQTPPWATCPKPGP